MKNGNSLVVQWLRLCAFTAESPGSIPGQGTIFHKLWDTAKNEKEHTHGESLCYIPETNTTL